jgi:hypothetical protein
MLPQANTFSLRYYIPSSNAIVTALYDFAVCRELSANSAADKAGDSPPPEEPYLSALFDLVQLQWHRMRMKRAIGGYYFKSRTAESVTERLYQRHRKHFNLEPTQRFLTFSRFAKPLKRSSELNDFIAASSVWDAEQKQFYLDFKRWITTANCESDIVALGALYKVLWYESNRPFLNWYQEQPPVRLSDDEEKLIKAIGEEGKEEDANMLQRVTEYIEEIKTGVAAKPSSSNPKGEEKA